MSSSEADLKLVTSRMILISLFILIFTGSFGSLCNILIFTSKQLRKNSCAVYFLCAALFELPILCIGIITRLMTENFGSQLINQNRVFCKIRSYLITAMGTVATYFVVLACIDRCMATSSNARCRAFSRIKIAYRVAAAVMIVCMIGNIHTIIYIDIQSSCIPQPGVYALFYSLYLIIFTGILPNALMLIFGIWTVRNIRHARRRVVQNLPANTVQQRHTHRIESQLVLMMLAQASSSIIIDVTQVSCYSYYFITASTPKTTYDQTVAVFIFQFSNIFLYLNYSKSFYIYTLTSSLYRKIFLATLRDYWRRFIKLVQCSDDNRTYPINVGKPSNTAVVVRFSNRRATAND